ncbi:MAG: GntR family transcriptional regulator [Anaerolineae bacterium]|nr:GntR family transcriptional regulator [Anaerolineae bacterium]
MTTEDGRYAFRRSERFALNPDSPVPLYHQMEQILLQRISQPDMLNKLLPSEADLGEMFGVSRATVKRALENLSRRGLLDRRRALGTRVTRPQITEDLVRLTSYTEEMEDKGLTIRTQVLDVGLQVPRAGVAEGLRLEADEQALVIKRLRGTNELFPVVLLETHIPTRFGISPEEDFSSSLYRIIEDKYQIPLEGAEETISARRASAEEARRLEIPRGSSVLVMERLTFTTGAQPLEFVRGVYRPDRYQFSIRLRRSPVPSFPR